VTDRPQYQARPTVYKGIKMRSRLEAGYAAWLDSWRFTWEYEPCAFANEAGQYLPDFLIRDVPRMVCGKQRTEDAYVEVKPASWTGDLNALARRMEIIWSDDDFGSGTPDLLLEVPGRLPRNLTHGPPDGELDWQEVVWVYDLTPDLREQLSLATPLWSESRPWPHGYWNGPQ
jgi:hypothetical protein